MCCPPASTIRGFPATWPGTSGPITAPPEPAPRKSPSIRSFSDCHKTDPFCSVRSHDALARSVSFTVVNHRTPMNTLHRVAAPELCAIGCGAGRITGKMCTREHHSPSFAYCITSRQALRLLAQVCLFLRTYKSNALACCSMSAKASHLATAATPWSNVRRVSNSRRASSRFPLVQ
jgi:hypothetical protein